MAQHDDLLAKIADILERSDKGTAVREVAVLLHQELPEAGSDRADGPCPSCGHTDGHGWACGFGEDVGGLTVETFPAPALRNQGDARAFLEQELPAWLELIDAALERGKLDTPALLTELGIVARRASRTLRTGRPGEVFTARGVPDFGHLARLIRFDVNRDCGGGGAEMLSRVLERGFEEGAV